MVWIIVTETSPDRQIRYFMSSIVNDITIGDVILCVIKDIHIIEASKHRRY